MNTQITFDISDKYEPGAIVKEQSNTDFYVILERKGEYVKIQRLKKSISGFLGTSKTIRVKSLLGVDPSHEPILKKVLKSKDHRTLSKEIGFYISNNSGYSWCSLCDLMTMQKI